MPKAAFIFPGQGAQYVGMAKDFYDACPAAGNAFDEANEALGFDIAKLCFEGPTEELTATKNSQPAILTASIAAFRAFKETKGRDIVPSACAGLSLGEYSALVAAEALSFRDAVKLVRKRGEFMEEASEKNPGRMAAVIGLAADVVEKIAAASGCEVANLNCPGQVIISGSSAAVGKAMDAARSGHSAKCVPLAVSGPFHSSLMTEASKRLRRELDKVELSKPLMPFVSNVTAAYEDNPGAIKENLALQVNHRTLWEKSVRLMMADGITSFYEIGPGAVLKGLLRKIDSNIRVESIEKISDVKL